MKPKIVVEIYRGIVSDIMTNQECDVVIIDHDTDGCDTKTIQLGKEKFDVMINQSNTVINKERVEQIFSQIERSD